MITPEQNADARLRIEVTTTEKPDGGITTCTRFTCMSRLSCPKHPESRELVRCQYQEGK